MRLCSNLSVCVPYCHITNLRLDAIAGACKFLSMHVEQCHNTKLRKHAAINLCVPYCHKHYKSVARCGCGCMQQYIWLCITMSHYKTAAEDDCSNLYVCVSQCRITKLRLRIPAAIYLVVYHNVTLQNCGCGCL